MSGEALAEDVITGIEPTAFWAEAGLAVSDKAQANDGAGRNGKQFILKVPEHKDCYACIGIWKDVETAKANLQDQFALIAVAPRSDPLDFGDEARSWPKEERKGATIIFRRANVTISISWPADRASGLVFARKIDQLLSKGHASVSKGALPTPPAIVGLPTHLELAKDQTKSVTVSFSGLGESPPAVWIYSPAGLKCSFSQDGTIKITRIAEVFAEQTIPIRAVSSSGVTVNAELLVKPKPE